MPLLAQQHVPIPTKDILSWCYDNRHAFDQDKPIYIDCATKRSISANQAYSLIRKLVAGFRAVGLRKGDCVCIHSFNNLYYPILVQGILGAGGVFVGTNPGYTPSELHHTLKTSEAKFIIAEPGLVSIIKKPAFEIGIPNKRVFLFAGHAEQTLGENLTWWSLLEHGEQDWVRFDDLETARNTTAFLMFSSGTTGLPKAAQLSHYNLIAEHTLVYDNPGHPEPYAMSRVCCLPFFHAAIAPYTHTSVLRSGREAYIMPRFDLQEFLVNIQRFHITSLIVVPPMVVAIVNYAKDHPQKAREYLRSVVSIMGGAAPLDRETQAAMQALLPQQSAFVQLWAMTETSCIASFSYYPEKDDTGSVGRFIPNIDAKIIDPETGEEIGPYDTRGELCVRGPTVIRGYLNNPEANSRDWDTEGYFHTGDIVYCSSKSKLWYVVDRRKELIKVRGFQVAPAEIEGVLRSHPNTADVAVIGIPAAEAGSELPRAYIIKRQGAAQMTEKDVKQFLEPKLAKYKQLDGGVRFVDSIPKTPSGKILKRVMREEVKREMAPKL